MQQKSEYLNVSLLNDLLQFDSLTIAGLIFTSRQVDILACILNGRSAKRISNILEISPKTVEVHIRNIMLKLGCNSQEAIIDFLEKTDKVISLRQHYLNLLLENNFAAALNDIKNAINKRSTCLIIYEDPNFNKTIAFNKTLEHLQRANINVFHRIKDTQDDLNYPDDIDLILDLRNFADNAPQLQSYRNVDLAKSENYYLFIFDILQILSPLENIEQHKTKFQSGSTLFTQQNLASDIDNKILPLQNNNEGHPLIRKNKLLIISGALACLFILICGISIVVHRSGQKVNLSNITPQHVQMGKEILEDFKAQMHNSQELLYKLSLKQTTARLYKFVKPSRHEILQLKNELQEIDRQLMSLNSTNLNLHNTLLTLDGKAQLNKMLKTQQNQLTLAKQITFALLMYLEDKHEQANKELDELIHNISNNKSISPVERNMLLNSAYNLKAKIAANNPIKPNKEFSVQYYKKAIEAMPTDGITWSNYAGLLIDKAEIEADPKLYLEAYTCFQQVYQRLEQIDEAQLPVVYSGMAYGLIMLAKSIDNQILDSSKNSIPSSIKLRIQAHDLLNKSLKINPNYVNSHLHLAMLFFDNKDYSQALQEINITLEAQPFHPVALMYKGYILSKLKHHKEALEYLNQARESLSHLPKHAVYPNWIGNISNEIMEIQKNK